MIRLNLVAQSGKKLYRGDSTYSFSFVRADSLSLWLIYDDLIVRLYRGKKEKKKKWKL